MHDPNDFSVGIHHILETIRNRLGSSRVSADEPFRSPPGRKESFVSGSLLPTNLRGILRRNKLHISIIGLSSLLTGLSELLFFIVIAKATVSLASDDERVAVVGGLSLTYAELMVTGAVLVVARLVSSLVNVRALSGLNYRVVSSTRLDLVGAYLDSDWSTKTSQPRGYVQRLIHQLPNEIFSVTKTMAQGFGLAMTFGSMLVGAIVVDPLSTLLVIVFLVLLLLLFAPIRRSIRNRSRRSMAANNRFSSYISEVSALGTEIHTFGIQRPLFSRLRDLVHSEATRQFRIGTLTGLIGPVYMTFVYAAALTVLAIVADSDVGSLEDSAASLLIMLRLLGLGQQMQSAWTSVSTSLPALEQINSTFLDLRDHEERTGSIDIDGCNVLEFDRVSFSYEDGRDVLREVSFSSHRGESVGVVGRSGAGKSTLMRLALGLLRPTEGRILVDGTDLSTMSGDTRRNLIAFVPQDVTLVAGSILDNVRCYRSGITEEAARLACHEALLAEEIADLPDGLATDLGLQGQRLSGGQRQRLAIARALVADPKFVLMDEPTSALDPISESKFRDLVKSLSTERLVLVIAHRYSTIKACDKLLLLEDGKVSYFGPSSGAPVDNLFWSSMVGSNE